MAKDQPGINNGLILCGDRIHELIPVSTTASLISDVISLEEVNVVQRKIKYGTSDASLVGEHTFNLKVYLNDTPLVLD